MLIKVVMALAFTISLCLSCAGQGMKPGDVFYCTQPDVFTSGRVSLGEPVVLFYMDTVSRSFGFIAYFGFGGAEGKTIRLEFRDGRGPEEHDGFTVVRKCRVTKDGYGENAETEALPKGGAGEKAVLRFISDWLKQNVPEPKRADLQRVLKMEEGPWEEWNKEMNKLSREDHKLYYLFRMLKWGKVLPANSTL